jgi:hypothetical protein
MANPKFAPSGMHPLVLKRLRVKRKRELQAEVKALYQVSNILWAVVKGSDTDALLAERFPRMRADIMQREITRAIEEGHIRSWGGRYLAIDPRHKVLKKRLRG